MFFLRFIDAVAKVLKMGKTTAVVQIDLYNDSGLLVAHGKIIYSFGDNILRKKKTVSKL